MHPWLCETKAAKPMAVPVRGHGNQPQPRVAKGLVAVETNHKGRVQPWQPDPWPHG